MAFFATVAPNGEAAGDGEAAADDLEVSLGLRISLAKVWALGSIAFSEAFELPTAHILPARPNRNMAERTSRLPQTASVTELTGGDP